MCEAQWFSPKKVIIWIIPVVWIPPKIPIWTSHRLWKVNVTKNRLRIFLPYPILNPTVPSSISTPDPRGGLGGSNTTDALFSRLPSNPFSTSASTEFYRKRLWEQTLSPLLTGYSPRSLPAALSPATTCRSPSPAIICHSLVGPLLRQRHSTTRRSPATSWTSCFVGELTWHDTATRHNTPSQPDWALSGRRHQEGCWTSGPDISHLPAHDETKHQGPAWGLDGNREYF